MTYNFFIIKFLYKIANIMGHNRENKVRQFEILDRIEGIKGL